MLASITPLGERGRHSHWPITFTAFLLGATASGAAAGLVLGTIGGLLLPASVGTHARLGVLAGAALIALILDLRARTTPGSRRQVDERWMDRYRGWVYGLGYGSQLGLGVTTVVSSAATYAALVAALIVASPGRGALVLGCYGAVRGLTPLAAAWVRSPQQLVALHAGLARWRRTATGGGLVALAAILALSLAGSLV